MTRPRVRVVLADDHPLFLGALVAAVRSRPDLDVVAAVTDGEEALAVVRDLRPDVAVLDMRLPGLDGAGVLDAVARDALSTRVLFISAHVTSDVVYDALAAGAGGYLSKEATADSICDAVAAVARGDTVLPPHMYGAVAREIRSRATAPARRVLSTRETEVLRLTADGCSSASAALALRLSESTVKTHLQSVYRKLEVSDRAAAVAEAMRRGLLD